MSLEVRKDTTEEFVVGLGTRGPKQQPGSLILPLLFEETAIRSTGHSADAAFHRSIRTGNEDKYRSVAGHTSSRIKRKTKAIGTLGGRLLSDETHVAAAHLVLLVLKIKWESPYLLLGHSGRLRSEYIFFTRLPYLTCISRTSK